MWAIAEVCERTGLSPRTIRYYEEIGLLPGVRRRAGGRRVYGPDELERLGFIHRLKALGLSLAEIGELNAVYAIGGSTSAMLSRLGDLLSVHLEDVDRRIDSLVDLRGELARYREHIEERIEQVAHDRSKDESKDESRTERLAVESPTERISGQSVDETSAKTSDQTSGKKRNQA
jgi:DNA-binding transcriptional MerR regulator